MCGQGFAERRRNEKDKTISKIFGPLSMSGHWSLHTIAEFLCKNTQMKRLGKSGIGCEMKHSIHQGSWVLWHWRSLKKKFKEAGVGHVGMAHHGTTFFGCAGAAQAGAFETISEVTHCHICCHFCSAEDTSWWLVHGLVDMMHQFWPCWCHLLTLVCLYPHGCWNQSAFLLVLIYHCDWIHYVSMTIIIIHHSDWFQSRFVQVSIDVSMISLVSTLAAAQSQFFACRRQGWS